MKKAKKPTVDELRPEYKRSDFSSLDREKFTEHVRKEQKITGLSGVVIGYDPGGNGNHGVAELQVKDGRAVALSTTILETAEHVAAAIERFPSVLALGVDTLTCWGTGRSGWRPADRWLRERYVDVQNSVMAPNGLRGSMGLNGMCVLIAARRRFPDVSITETHPKVLYLQLSGNRYNYDVSKTEMDAVLAHLLGIPATPENEHEWDAAISAFAALEGVAKRWLHDLHDLHQLPIHEGERLITPCGSTHYFWPE